MSSMIYPIPDRNIASKEGNGLARSGEEGSHISIFTLWGCNIGLLLRIALGIIIVRNQPCEYSSTSVTVSIQPGSV